MAQTGGEIEERDGGRAEGSAEMWWERDEWKGRLMEIEWQGRERQRRGKEAYGTGGQRNQEKGIRGKGKKEIEILKKDFRVPNWYISVM